MLRDYLIASIIILVIVLFLETKFNNNENNNNNENTVHCQGSWSEWTDCSFGNACSVIGSQTKTFTKMSDPENGGNACPTETTLTQSCSRALPIECQPMDCAGTWTPWSACEFANTCDTQGVQSKTFHVTQNARNGGTACPTETTLTQSCSRALPTECRPVDCAGVWEDTSTCTYENECSTEGYRTQTFRVTQNARNSGIPCPIITTRRANCNRPLSGRPEICDPNACIMSDWTIGECTFENECDTYGKRTDTRTIIRDTNNNCPNPAENRAFYEQPINCARPLNELWSDAWHAKCNKTNYQFPDNYPTNVACETDTTQAITTEEECRLAAKALGKTYLSSSGSEWLYDTHSHFQGISKCFSHGGYPGAHGGTNEITFYENFGDNKLIGSHPFYAPVCRRKPTNENRPLVFKFTHYASEARDITLRNAFNNRQATDDTAILNNGMYVSGPLKANTSTYQPFKTGYDTQGIPVENSGWQAITLIFDYTSEHTGAFAQIFSGYKHTNTQTNNTLPNYPGIVLAGFYYQVYNKNLQLILKGLDGKDLVHENVDLSGFMNTSPYHIRAVVTFDNPRNVGKLFINDTVVFQFSRRNNLTSAQIAYGISMTDVDEVRINSRFTNENVSPNVMHEMGIHPTVADH
jgi:hypothetical protein